MRIKISHRYSIIFHKIHIALSLFLLRHLFHTVIRDNFYTFLQSIYQNPNFPHTKIRPDFLYPSKSLVKSYTFFKHSFSIFGWLNINLSLSLKNKIREKYSVRNILQNCMEFWFSSAEKNKGKNDINPPIESASILRKLSKI